MAWEVLLHTEVDDWFLALCHDDPGSAALIAAAIDKLANDGPALGRPLVDTVRESRNRRMKELRPGSAGSTEIRILFAFDPARRAILLVAGDKSGSWQHWYRNTIPIADQRFEDHLAGLRDDDS